MPRSARFKPIDGGPWEGLFAVRHCSAGWLRDLTPGWFNFCYPGSEHHPKLYDIISDATTAMYEIAGRMGEPIRNFRVERLVVMTERFWEDEGRG